MRTNNTFNLNEIITVVLPSSISTIVVYKYLYGQTKALIQSTKVTKGIFNYFTIDPILEDCYLFVSYASNVEFIRVGTPPTMLLLHYNKPAPIFFTQYDYNSNILNSSNLLDLGDNYYATFISTVLKNFYVIEGRIITITPPNKFDRTQTTLNGSILLERGIWQLIAIPNNGKIKEDFIDKVSLQEGVSGASLFEVASAYPGQINKFLSYIPGFTSPTSEHNFNLVYDDNGSKEITAFWIKCKDWTHTTNNILFNWNYN
jgi:hypothetical protein